MTRLASTQVDGNLTESRDGEQPAPRLRDLLFLVGISFVSIDILHQAVDVMVFLQESAGRGSKEAINWWPLYSAFVIIPGNILALILTPSAIARRHTTFGLVYLILCFSVWLGPLALLLIAKT